MDEQGYRFGVGVLVVASVTIAVILILFFGAAPNLFKQQYEVTIRFDAAPGVATDTPVRKNGVRIGRVKSIRLIDETESTTGGVDLTLELDGQYKILSRDLPQVGIGSLITNEAVIEFVSPTEDSMLTRFDGVAGSPQDRIIDENERLASLVPIKDGDYLSGGRVAPDPFNAINNMQTEFASTLQSIRSASDQFTALANDVRTLVGGGDGELKRIAAQAEQTIANLNRTLAAVEQTVGDPALRDTIATVSDRLPELIDSADRVLRQTDATIASFQGVGQAAEAAVQNITEFTEPFGEQGNAMVSEVRSTVRNLDALLVDLRGVSATVNRFAQRVNSGQGTLAKLVDDDELYYSILYTLQNVETITRRLQPIVEDARVASDKIARNPGGILRDALTGSRGGLK